MSLHLSLLVLHILLMTWLHHLLLFYPTVLLTFPILWTWGVSLCLFFTPSMVWDFIWLSAVGTPVLRWPLCQSLKYGKFMVNGVWKLMENMTCLNDYLLAFMFKSRHWVGQDMASIYYFQCVSNQIMPLAFHSISPVGSCSDVLYASTLLITFCIMLFAPIGHFG